jgi:CheY-like chemotaxis protein
MDNEPKIVMVVEPDVLVRMSIAEYLRDCGYQVIEGVSATDVWAVLDIGRPVHVVMVDVKLGSDSEGFVLASQIRQTHRNIRRGSRIGWAVRGWADQKAL